MGIILLGVSSQTFALEWDSRHETGTLNKQWLSKLDALSIVNEAHTHTYTAIAGLRSLDGYLGPPVVPFYPSLVDYRKKGYPYSNLPTGGPSYILYNARNTMEATRPTTKPTYPCNASTFVEHQHNPPKRPYTNQPTSLSLSFLFCWSLIESLGAAGMSRVSS